MIDLHCHILPGIDDGPPTVEDSLELARRAVEGGIRKVVATPHVNDRYGLGPDDIESAVADLRRAFEDADVELELLGGAEIAISRLLELDDAALGRLTLGHSDTLLVEAPLEPVVGDIESLAARLLDKGHGVLLAHPERSPPFQREPDRLVRMVEDGALCSITAGAVEGRFGAPVQRFAFELLERGLVHDIASDAHDAWHRPPDLSTWVEAAEGRVGKGLADWLTVDAPSAILGGEPLPAAPAGVEKPVKGRRRFPWPSSRQG